ncbi:rhodanese-like domain-containing protein [Cryobacterium sinapicolor]|uniref:Rhodanese-like domain-containing protein n=1 Tax=Cryobacterium sinapicolor TaxID=1259236 RepID=A0ABY2J3I7_9MICO|nr:MULTISPECIES: rhodanese-like domain-containing protein [Cryobacterium]TFC89087.1 rhodanese-like domain-containing protein [Cryobacterium sp. TMT3-29-2]TFC99487.1 rhodanese-like domain-containing protein [Cryobacterium sinapicolor]
MKNLVAALVLAGAALFGLTACSAPAAPAARPSVSADSVVIDVRTPGEYAAGHLDGAMNIDVQASDFDSQVSALPTDGDYVVYCRSGSRSAAAVARMGDLGFTSVTDAGAMSAATVSTGLPIVTTP